MLHSMVSTLHDIDFGMAKLNLHLSITYSIGSALRPKPKAKGRVKAKAKAKANNEQITIGPPATLPYVDYKDDSFLIKQKSTTAVV